jgi:squalene-hopene/tetraprenyl-beta-curcumene cyclase
LAQNAVTPPPPDYSFRNEVQLSIARGLAWLEKKQDTNGWWSSADLPALSGMVLTAFKGDPSGKYAPKEPEFIGRGYAYLLKNVKPDGGIYAKDLITYNTAISMMALVAANKPEYDPILRKGRALLVSLQTDMDEPGKTDSIYDGGIGYGTRYKHSDMGNTLSALEAIYYTKHLAADKTSKEPDLNYAAAIHFLQNCQNLASVNKQDWVADDATNKGGFVYYPGYSNAGSDTNAATGKVSLRSYGSISYAGMLSYLYADLKRDDPRVQAVYEWVRGNYTLEENPGMGPQGMYFYYHTMSKALALYGMKEIELKDGRKVNWRKEAGMKLLNLQRQDGSWVNESNRWMEKDPVLVTSYTLLALEMIYRGL